MEGTLLIKYSGHYKNCFTPVDGLPINSDKPRCSGTINRLFPNSCSAQVCMQGCLKSHSKAGVTGLCFHHWSAHCDDMGWDIDLCRCANRRCDKLNLTLKERHQISPDNILEKIGMRPGPFHFSKTRLRQIRMVELKAKNKNSRKMAKMEKELVDLTLTHHLHQLHLEQGYKRFVFPEADSDDSRESECRSDDDSCPDYEPKRRKVIDLTGEGSSSDHDVIIMKRNTNNPGPLISKKRKRTDIEDEVHSSKKQRKQ